MLKHFIQELLMKSTSLDFPQTHQHYSAIFVSDLSPNTSISTAGTLVVVIDNRG